MADTDGPPDFLSSVEQSDRERRARLKRSVLFKMEDLPAVDHGRFNQPLSLGEGFKVHQAVGDTLFLRDIHQYGTNGGLLLGVPKYPEFELESVVDYASRLFPYHDAPPYVVPPTIHRGVRIRVRDGVEDSDEWAMLPPVTSIGVFGTSRPATDSDEAYSSVILIWFQDKYGLPDDPATLRHIEGIGWEPFAHSYTG